MLTDFARNFAWIAIFLLLLMSLMAPLSGIVWVSDKLLGRPASLFVAVPLLLLVTALWMTVFKRSSVIRNLIERLA